MAREKCLARRYENQGTLFVVTCGKCMREFNKDVGIGELICPNCGYWNIVEMKFIPKKLKDIRRRSTLVHPDQKDKIPTELRKKKK